MGNDLVASTNLSTSTQFISFTITNNSGIDYVIDQFSFGVGRNVQTSAHFLSTVTIGATTTQLTANSTLSTSSSGPGDFTVDLSAPLVQYASPSGTNNANAWAKPIYEPNLTLGIGQTAEFRIYHTAGANSTFMHLNNLNVELSVIPEPSTYAAIFGMVALGVIVWRRRKLK